MRLLAISALVKLVAAETVMEVVRATVKRVNKLRLWVFISGFGADFSEF
jgi:hypothetical protein